jgi:DNA invertase Pin-like site-specific DNA recombinase
MTKAIVRRELMRRNASVTSIEQPKYDLYSKDPGDYLINAIMEALDVYERMSIALKLARGRTVKAKGGDKPAGVCPYGYQYSADKKSIEVNEAEAATVKKMFTLGQTGESLSKIADKINATGALTRHGKPFSKGTIAAILNNDFYTGVLTHAGQTIKGNHTPIISKIQYGKVQSQLSKRKRG